jgi:sugar phosphate isomerase/epimerase
MLGQQRILYNGTAGAHRSFGDFLTAAKAGGFTAISLFPQVYVRARQAGRSDADLLRMLADHGLRVCMIDPLLKWVPGHDFPFSHLMPAQMPAIDTVFRIAHALQAPAINVVWARRKRIAPTLLADAFGQLCQRAARDGLHVHLEFLPWSQINNVHAALALIGQVGAANSGVMFDCWHHFRSGVPDADLAGIAGGRVTALQICDARARRGWIPELESLRSRRLPGEGVIRLTEILRHLENAGCKATPGLEVFSSKLNRHAPGHLGQLAGSTLAALLTKLPATGGAE